MPRSGARPAIQVQLILDPTDHNNSSSWLWPHCKPDFNIWSVPPQQAHSPSRAHKNRATPAWTIQVHLYRFGCLQMFSGSHHNMPATRIASNNTGPDGPSVSPHARSHSRASCVQRRCCHSLVRLRENWASRTNGGGASPTSKLDPVSSNPSG